MTTLADRLAGRGRTDAPMHPPQGEPTRLSQREADALLQAQLLDAVRAQAASTTELAALLRGGQLTNGLLDVGTGTLDANGLLTRDWSVAAGSAAITNHGTADIYVNPGPTAQTTGRGAWRIRAGASAVVYLSTTIMTISGAAGTSVSWAVFTGVCPPSWGTPGTGGSSGGTTSSTATRSNVAASLTAVDLAAANANRKGLTILNDSTATLYVALGSGATATDCTAILPGSMSYYEVPAGYTGQVTGIWSAASGAARVTELT